MHFTADRLEQEAGAVVRRWSDGLESGTERDGALTGLDEDRLLHVARLIRRFADFVRDADEARLRRSVVKSLTCLAERRRREGFDLEEVLTEYRGLSDLVQELAEKTVGEFPGHADMFEIVRTWRRLREAIGLLDEVTSRTYRQWSARLADERSAVLQSFASMLAHELKNRVGAAETAVRLLMEPNTALDDERRAHLLDLILGALQGAGRVVDDVQALSSAGQSEGVLVPTAPVRLGTLLEEITRRMRVEANRKQVELIVDGDMPSGTVDGGCLHIALTNVLDNAMRYRHSDCRPRVQLLVERAAARTEWVLSVGDNGKGMSADLLNRVFEPRIRARRPGDAGDAGPGLGLFLAQTAIEQLRGGLRIESEPGAGTTVYLVVPEYRPPTRDPRGSGRFGRRGTHS